MLGKKPTHLWRYPEGSGKLFLETWLEVGTLSLTAKTLYARGTKNRTGGVPHVGSIRQVVNRWIVNNMSEAREMLLANDYDRLSDDKEWAAFTIPRANACLKESVMFRWLLKHGFLEYARELKYIPEDYGKDRTI